MSSIDRFSSWKENPPILRIIDAMKWFAASESGWPSDHAGSSSALFSAPRKPFASSRRPPAPRSARACSASPITSRMPEKLGSSQLIDGWPSLK